MPDHAGLYKRDDRFALVTELDHPDLCYSEIRRYLLIMLSKDPDRLVTWRDLAYRMRKARRTFTRAEVREGLAKLAASGEFAVIDEIYGFGPGMPTRKYGRRRDAPLEATG